MKPAAEWHTSPSSRAGGAALAGVAGLAGSLASLSLPSLPSLVSFLAEPSATLSRPPNEPSPDGGMPCWSS